MDGRRIADTAIDATAEDGVVMLDGDGGLAASLTPEAAAETGKRIAKAAEHAAKQRAKVSTPKP